MKVKKLIDILNKQNPDDEVVLWTWTKSGSVIQHIAELLQHKKTKGFYEIGINEMKPIITQREWSKFPKEE